MLFNSWQFVIFLVIVAAIYYEAARRNYSAQIQATILFFSSLYFYSFQNPKLVLLLLFSISINFCFCKLICTTDQRYGYLILTAGVAVNLALLSFFKYAGLIVETFIPENMVSNFSINITNIPLPIGISFFTFQAISLLVDTYRNTGSQEYKVRDTFTKNSLFKQIVYTGFYISFFPQLVAGPIVVANSFLTQIKRKLVNNVDWVKSFTYLTTGFFLKLVVADNIKDVTTLLNTDFVLQMGKLDLIFILYGYSFQIFADFAGYSLIALGLGALFGYSFPRNFNFPYLSTSVTDFWRRWHISLSSFLRDYFYKPLGGSRKGRNRTYANLMIVMVFGGLWHGAAWSYAVWGAAHGLLLVCERFYKNNVTGVVKAGGSSINKSGSKFNFLLKKIFNILFVFNITSALWLLFVMPDISHVMRFFGQIKSSSTLVSSPQNLYIVTIFSIPIVLYHIDAFVIENYSTCAYCTRYRKKLKPIILAVMLFLISVNSGTPGTFIYFQF